MKTERPDLTIKGMRHFVQRSTFAIFLLFLALSSEVVAQSATDDDPLEQSTTRPATITYTDAIILGIVEGLTEYLPVSSTGHLILANNLLGLDSDQPVLEAKSDEDDTKTLGDAANAYIIIIQGGAILAVLIIYWRRVADILAGIFGRSTTGLLLFRNLMVAFAPAVVLGLLFEDWIDRHLFGILPVVNALIVGAFLMLAVEHWRRRRLARNEIDEKGPDLHELSVSRSLLIGLLQCVAMWPGMSRSMMTIVGGYFAGLSPAKAAEFSFLLGLITLSAASGYKTLKEGAWMVEAMDPGPVLVGVLVATIFAALSVKWLVSYLEKHGLGIFAWYRIILAIAVYGLLIG